MEILRVEPKSYEKSVLPAIRFEVELAHIKFQEAIVNIEGWVESDDGKILARVQEIPENLKSEIRAKGSRFDSEFKNTVYTTNLIALLDKKAVSYIDKRRIGNKKHDIFLTLNLNVRIIVSRARISTFHQIDPNEMRIPKQVKVASYGRRNEGMILAYGSDSQFSTDYNNLWILSGDGNPVFLTVANQTIRKEGVRIPSVDWIHDFAPKLGLGEYFIVEIPKGKNLIKEAWDYIEKAEECYGNWNTKGAYANCREVGHLLERIIKDKFRDDPVIKKWKRAIDKFEPLTSMDLHEEDIKNQKPMGKITVGRPETEYILIVTKALIKYTEELLLEKS